MDMFRIPQHVEDELQALLKLLCPSVIMLKSQMLNESIEISSILIKKEKIELLGKVKEDRRHHSPPYTILHASPWGLL
jgi:hypothetical protein